MLAKISESQIKVQIFRSNEVHRAGSRDWDAQRVRGRPTKVRKSREGVLLRFFLRVLRVLARMGGLLVTSD
jgi:hypothetical protein